MPSVPTPLYTPPHEAGYSEAIRQQAVKLYMEGNNYRRFARVLGGSHTSVMNWVNTATNALPDAPLPEQLTVIEEDELFTFVQRKKTKFTLSP